MTHRLTQDTPGHAHDGCDVQASGAIELYFYGELASDERHGVDRHLAGCRHCRHALQELGEIRVALAARPDVSAPTGGDWSGFMARLDASVEDKPAAGVLPFAASKVTTHRYVTYLAMAALLALVTISVLLAARARVAAPAIETADIRPTPAGDEGATTSLAALSEQHFERSKLVVLGLAAKDPEQSSGADWEYERKLASTLLSDTRLYRLAAEERGMTAVAGVMRDLELVLLQASMSDETDAATLAQIQRLIQRRDLLGKMTVVATRGL